MIQKTARIIFYFGEGVSELVERQQNCRLQIRGQVFVFIHSEDEQVLVDNNK